MKILYFIACLLISTFITIAGTARPLTLAWDSSPDTNVTGYKVYLGPASRTYSTNINVHAVQLTTVSNLATGQPYYFTVTAYNAAGLESDFANEIVCLLSTTGQSSTLVWPVTNQVVTVLHSIDLISWEVLLSAPAQQTSYTWPASPGSHYYRATTSGNRPYPLKLQVK